MYACVRKAALTVMMRVCDDACVHKAALTVMCTTLCSFWGSMSRIYCSTWSSTRAYTNLTGDCVRRCNVCCKSKVLKFGIAIKSCRISRRTPMQQVCVKHGSVHYKVLMVLRKAIYMHALILTCMHASKFNIQPSLCYILLIPLLARYCGLYITYNQYARQSAPTW